jgi:hypothetical protein
MAVPAARANHDIIKRPGGASFLNKTGGHNNHSRGFSTMAVLGNRVRLGAGAMPAAPPRAAAMTTMSRALGFLKRAARM